MRLTLPPLTLLSTLASISLAAARGTTYTIHSRLIAPASSTNEQQQQPFRQTGTVQVDVDVSSFAIALDGNGEVILPQARWIPLQHAGNTAEVNGKAEVMMDDAWLQVAVQVEGMEEDLWPRTVVRACHLPYANHSTLSLHVNTYPPHPASTSTGSHILIDSSNSSDLDLESPHPSFQPYAITYRVSDIPADNACRAESKGRSVPVDWVPEVLTGRDSVEVVLKTRKVVHSPYIPTAAPITATTGAGATSTGPVVEKSFLQKYWLYIAGAGMAVLLVGTQEAPAQG